VEWILPVALSWPKCLLSIGSIIFGGVDTKKFIGALAKVPIVTRPATPTGLDG
jgi:hypothetical protein